MKPKPTNKTVHPLDEIVKLETAFECMDDLVNAKGGYFPSLWCVSPRILAIADAYDLIQAQRGDPRRAFRSNLLIH